MYNVIDIRNHAAVSGLERVDGNAEAERKQEQRADAIAELTRTLKRDFLAAMHTQSTRVPFAVRKTLGSVYACQPDAWIQVCITALTREDECEAELRAVLETPGCARITALRSAITAQLFRDYSESVMSTLESAHVAEALRDVLMHSQAHKVEQLRQSIADWYELAHAQVLAEILTQ